MMAEEAAAAEAARQQQKSRAVVICTSPRSSSYLLSEAIEATGCLGTPREYFDADAGKERWWVERLGITGPENYIEKVIARGSTSNGVWGLKLHWYQIPDLINRFVASPASHLQHRPNLTFVDCLKTRFRDIDYVWLRRENKVAQAISWCRAMKTGVWHVRPKAEVPAATPNLQFDFDEIDRQVQEFVDADRGWYEFFRAHRIRVLVVVYEHFLKTREDYANTMRQVIQYLGVDPDTVPIRPPPFRQQSDALSIEWEAEYRRRKEELARLGALDGTATSQTARPAVHVPAAHLPVVAPVAAAPADVPAKRTAPRREARAMGAPRPVVPPPQTAAPPPDPREPAVAPDTLTAYLLNPAMTVPIATATQRRQWIEDMPHRFAYRCLPLVIANQYGWMLLCPSRITAVWSGNPGIDQVTVEYAPEEKSRFASSHFGSGILTFSIPYLFRTPPGTGLHVRGPANHPKDGISPLEGIIETDWSEATFTMNWVITRPGHPVVFEKDEPFAMISPVALADIERVRPEIRPIADNPVLQTGYLKWAESRHNFNRDLKVEGSDARKQKWQRHYIKGETVTDKKAPEHRTTMSLQEFTDRLK
jgi:LPS sulfotransferase NodH